MYYKIVNEICVLMKMLGIKGHSVAAVKCQVYGEKISYHQVRVLDGCQNCSYFPSLNSFDQWGDKQ